MRARFYFFNRFFDIEDPDAPEFFHFVINTSMVGEEYAIGMIMNAIDALREGKLQ